MSAEARSVETDVIDRLRTAVCRVVLGKSDVVDLTLTAILASGHVLVEDVPGVGKTTLASAVATAIGGTFARVQFTADLLPGDITGVTVLKDGDFAFRMGPVFANVVMADEINRSSPRTQSALFEAMGEGRVTVDGQTRELPRPFCVLATQNPYDLHGTYPLPDSQLDRFLMRLSVGYPDEDSERIVLRRHDARPTLPEPVTSPEQLEAVVRRAEQVVLPVEVEDYVMALVRRSRQDGRLLRGISTRAAVGLVRAVRAYALVHGRTYAIPEDVRRLAVPVLAHRVLPRVDGGPAGRGGRRAIEALLTELRPPGGS